MSQYSTSKMLGKLGIQKQSGIDEDILSSQHDSLEEQVNRPSLELKPTDPAMKEVLSHILGSSCSKKYTPMDK